MLKPVCVRCHMFFRPRKNGEFITEGMPVGGERREPGLSDPSGWKPYKVWMVDKWECPGCGVQIFAGSGAQPVTEHYQENFEELHHATGADKYQVNDC